MAYSEKQAWLLLLYCLLDNSQLNQKPRFYPQLFNPNNFSFDNSTC